MPPIPAAPELVPVFRISVPTPKNTSAQRPTWSPSGYAPRVHRLLRGEGELLDREVEPDREREVLEDPLDAEREPLRVVPLGRDVREGSTLKSVSAAMKKNSRIPSERKQTTTVNRIVVSIPAMFSPTKIANATSHQTWSGMSRSNSSIVMTFMYAPIATTTTRRGDHVLHVLGAVR